MKAELPLALIRPLLCALFVAATACPAQANAQGTTQVWRCGPEGRVFSDRPCSDGSPQAVKLQARDDDDVQAARQVARREQKFAQAMEAEREERARVAPGAGLIGIGPTQAERQAELQARDREWELSRVKKQRQYRQRPRPSAR